MRPMTEEDILRFDGYGRDQVTGLELEAPADMSLSTGSSAARLSRRASVSSKPGILELGDLLANNSLPQVEV